MSFPKKSRLSLDKPKKRPSQETQSSSKVKKQKVMDFLAHPKRKIAIQFFYLGWEHDGLVQQDNTDNTVEHHLIQALLKTKLIESWDSCEFSRCGRTDKGVSAFKQTAAFLVRSNSPDGEHVFWEPSTPDDIKDNYKAREELPYIKILNGTLPKTIRVFAWSPVDRNFSARHNCNKRTYKYSFPKAGLNLEAMRDGAKRLIGEHCFVNFCLVDMNEKRLNDGHVRKIFDVTVEQVSENSDDIYSMVELTVSGSGFLWHQIRYIVTVLQEIGRENEHPSIISDLLDLKKYPARPQYTTASDTPLCLFDCGYSPLDVKWIHDDETTRKCVSGLQKTWAAYQSRTRMMENMISDLTKISPMSLEQTTKGLHEFVQDRPIPAQYVRFEKREKCETLEVKREKMKKKNEKQALKESTPSPISFEVVFQQS